MTGLTREDIIAKACELGFEDVGFTTAEPFDTHLDFLKDRQDEYGWAEAAGLKLMEGYFGRCYLDDDRVTKDGLSRRITAFRSFLRDGGIDSKVPYHLPHRVAAARPKQPPGLDQIAGLIDKLFSAWY
jgi:epoxyqueuosine reductase